MSAYLTFFPLGNADTTVIRLANEDLVLMDYANMRVADDSTDKRTSVQYSAGLGKPVTNTVALGSTGIHLSVAPPANR